MIISSKDKIPLAESCRISGFNPVICSKYKKTNKQRLNFNDFGLNHQYHP